MKKVFLLIFIITLVLAFNLTKCQQNTGGKLTHITGQTMGTITYNVKFLGEGKNLKMEIDQVLHDLNRSLSTYITDSEISRLNKNGRLTFESDFFYPVLLKSKEVFEISGGAFDPSIGPLVQAWGFGPDKQISNLTQSVIDSLKEIIGFEKVQFDENSIQLPENYQLDFSSIAKGYAVDLVAELLEKKKIENFLVEIGGEVRCNGLNEKEKSWSLGIEDPAVTQTERQILAIARLKDKSLATSGNYRNYYEKEGKIYAHIIDPRTGYTANHNLLSASVFANDCITADAYATAFMVLGLEESFSIVNENADIDAILIYQSEDGGLRSLVSKGIKSFVELIEEK